MIKIKITAADNAKFSAAVSVWEELSVLENPSNTDLLNDGIEYEVIDCHLYDNLTDANPARIMYLFIDGNGNYRTTNSLECEKIRSDTPVPFYTNAADEEFFPYETGMVPIYRLNLDTLEIIELNLTQQIDVYSKEAVALMISENSITMTAEELAAFEALPDYSEAYKSLTVMKTKIFGA